MKTYTIKRNETGEATCTVTENGKEREINPRTDLIPYSEHFSFNNIQGTSQLSLALLADCLGNDDDRAIELHE